MIYFFLYINLIIYFLGKNLFLKIIFYSTGFSSASIESHTDDLLLYSSHQKDTSDENFNTKSQNDAIIGHNPLDRGPYYDVSASRNVTALVGKTAYLNCRIKNLGNKTVSL